MPTLPSRRGFTLVEAVTTLAVMAVLGALALPTLGGRADRARLTGAAEQLAADIADARFEAARSGQALHLSARTAGAGWCWAVSASPGCDCGTRQACQLKTVQAQDHPGVRLLDEFAVQLHPGGEIDSLPARLEGRDGQRLRVATIPSGRVRICRETGDEAGRLGRYAAC